MNDKIIAYYEDQVGFYTKRMKRAEKIIKDNKRLGLPDNFLHTLVYQDEKDNVEKYSTKLKQAKMLKEVK